MLINVNIIFPEYWIIPTLTPINLMKLYNGKLLAFLPLYSFTFPF